MINKQKHRAGQERRIERARYKLKQNGDRPRLVFNKTNRYLIAQVIDDTAGNTMLDRSGIIYHGKLAAFAESARKEGLEF